MSNAVKGMVLAAGFGTRLRPITDKKPKALVEVKGRPIIEYSLALLKRGGMDEVVINLHHLGEKIEEYLGDGSRYGLKLSYSHEKKILGTGGALKKVERFFGDDPIVVLNCDLISDIDLRKVLEFHLNNNFDATLVLRELQKGEGYTPVEVEDGRVKGFGAGRHMYTGIQVVTKEVTTKLPENEFSNIVGDAYTPLLKEGAAIGAYIFDGFWDEIGTIKKLKELAKIEEF